MSAFEADRFNRSRTSPHLNNSLYLNRADARVFRSFASLRISPAGSRFAHARRSAQFQPLTHLSALNNFLYSTYVRPVSIYEMHLPTANDGVEKTPVAFLLNVRP